MRADTAWWTPVHALDGLDVAEALGLPPAWGRGRASRWRLPHGDCPGAQGDGEPAVYYGSESRRLCCRKCSKTLSNLAIIAAYLGIGEPICDAVQAEAAAHGWCEPPAQVDAQALAARRAESTRLQAQRAREREAAEERRRIEAIDVGVEWHALPATGGVSRWAEQARGWPRRVAEALGDAHARVLVSRPPGGRLDALARHWGRHLIIPIRGHNGEVLSASCRYHLPGTPHDGGPKALTLPASATTAGTLAGRPHAFGDMDYSLDIVARGGTLVLGEGGPDWLAAVALCRLAGGDAQALAACSAQLMPALAQHVRAHLRARIGGSGALPRIIIAGHRDQAGEAGAQAAAEALAHVGRVRVARWPEGCDDLADVVRDQGEGAGRVLFG